MRAILQKTVGGNFKAGDVLVGENSRIKRLRDKGIVTLDHSVTGMFGAAITIIFASFLLIVDLLTFAPTTYHWSFGHGMQLWWQITFAFILIVTILLNIAHLINAQIPYSTYFLGFGAGIVGSVLTLLGHETSRSKYQSSLQSAIAAVILYTIGTILMVVGVLTVLDSTIGFTGIRNVEKVSFIMWIIYILFFIMGMVFAMYFDISFKQRRRRYIAFLKRKNATVEYKTKALKAYRAYQASGNAEEFMIKNIEFLEEQLGIDRAQIENTINNEKNKEK